jgi:hypothetical protein
MKGKTGVFKCKRNTSACIVSTIRVAAGITKTIPEFIGRSRFSQQEILQSINAGLHTFAHSIAVPVFVPCFEVACPWAAHSVPLQQFIPRACHVAANRGI